MSHDLQDPDQAVATPKADDDADGRSDLARAYQAAGPYLQIGWTLAGSLAVGTLGGHWLDQKFETTPWLLLLGSLLGMTVGFIQLFRTISRLP